MNFPTKGRLSVADGANGGWIGRLPQGTIELVAVSHHPSKDQSQWRPDGSPYTSPPIGHGCFNSGERQINDFAFRFQGLPNDYSPKLRLFPPINSGNNIRDQMDLVGVR